MRYLALIVLLAQFTATAAATAQECPEICDPGETYSDATRTCVPDDKKTS